MWEAMREKTTFTVRDIAWASGREKTTVRDYLKLLIKGGIIVETDPVPPIGRRTPTKQYRLLKDIGHEAPRLNPDGTARVMARDQMWRSMKMLSSFNYVDLALASSTDVCSISEADAKDYCKHLFAAGYLQLVAPATPTSKAVYKLFPSRNTGPIAPMVQRTKVVFDPNLNQVMWFDELNP